MNKKVVNEFIKKYDLFHNIFAITKEGIFHVDDEPSGFYVCNKIKNIDYKDIPYDLIEPLDIFECIIFNRRDIILSLGKTWHGYQPNLIFEDYYDDISSPFDF